MVANYLCGSCYSRGDRRVRFWLTYRVHIRWHHKGSEANTMPYHRGVAGISSGFAAASVMGLAIALAVALELFTPSWMEAGDAPIVAVMILLAIIAVGALFLVGVFYIRKLVKRARGES